MAPGSPENFGPTVPFAALLGTLTDLYPSRVAFVISLAAGKATDVSVVVELRVAAGFVLMEGKLV